MAWCLPYNREQNQTYHCLLRIPVMETAINQVVIQVSAKLQPWKEVERSVVTLITCEYTEEFWCQTEQNFVLPKECKGALISQEGRAALCRH